MLRNGTIDALNEVTATGKYRNGRDLLTTYLGIPLLDHPISIVVAFFDDQTNGLDLGARLMMVEFLGSLQTVALWTLVESLRTQQKPTSMTIPAVWGLLWNASGSALILPIYMYFHMRWWCKTPKGSDMRVPLHHAKVLSFSVLAGAFLPAAVLLLPPYVDRDPTSHQAITAIFQASPVFVFVIQHAISKITSRFSGSRQQMISDESTQYVQRAYLLTGLIAALAHLYVFAVSLGTENSALGFSRIFVPSPEQVLRSSDSIVKEGALLFLQYDWIITNVACVLWIFFLLRGSLEGPFGLHDIAKVLGLCGLALALGPGAMGSLGLWWREKCLEKSRGLSVQENGRK
ncbi:hypothetical protein FQN57_006809 [Myotisia sp. PD_48]|nr:hypothetical protein FQN57_006809 [Myotisia sp. PD_48]